MSVLGIYFGPKSIGMVETQGKKALKSIVIPQPALGADLEGKAHVESKLIQMAALFKDEFRKNKIVPGDSVISLSGRELIIRAFEMPLLPRSELRSAINYEVKKYIPFKVEDMISDYQVQFNRDSRVNLVLFVGIKKEILDKYVTLSQQLGLKLSSIEYSAFSMLRCLKLAGLRDKGVAAVINADLDGTDEANFTVLKNGFPLFSRDFLLNAGQEELAQAKEPAAPGMALEKLKTEIRVSLDYYMRKFSEAAIQRIFFAGNPETRQDIELFFKEAGLSLHFVDTSRYLGKSVPFSLSLAKGFGASLAKGVKSSIRVDTLSKKPQADRPAAAEADIQQQLAVLMSGLQVDFRVVAIGILICAATFIAGVVRISSYQKALDEARQARPQLALFTGELNTEEELQALDTDYKKKIRLLNELVNKQFYLARALDIIPRILPDGLWITNLSFSKSDGSAELKLSGKVYTGDSDKDLELVNRFIANLKAEPDFNKLFSEVDIEAVTQAQTRDVPVVDFVVVCRNKD